MEKYLKYFSAWNTFLLDLIIVMNMFISSKRKDQMAGCLFHLWWEKKKGNLGRVVGVGGSLAVVLCSLEVEIIPMVIWASYFFGFARRCSCSKPYLHSQVSAWMNSRPGKCTSFSTLPGTRTATRGLRTLIWPPLVLEIGLIVLAPATVSFQSN